MIQVKLFLNTLIRGSGERPTRLHDERGNLVTAGGWFYVFASLWSTFLRRCFGYRPPIPWLSYRAQTVISRILRTDWVVLEFGSGMSTAWFAQRCRAIYSYEHDPVWYETVRQDLIDKKIKNVCYTLRDKERYADLNEFLDRSFDFILIDGIRRAECARNAISKVKAGGWIYLDNTDMSQMTKPGNDSQVAEQLLIEAIKFNRGSVKYFTDLVPNNFLAKQGMLVHIGESHE